MTEDRKLGLEMELRVRNGVPKQTKAGDVDSSTWRKFLI